MKVDSTEFVGYFPKMRELAKAGAVLTVEDGEKVYEFRAVRDLPPISLEQWPLRLIRSADFKSFPRFSSLARPQRRSLGDR